MKKLLIYLIIPLLILCSVVTPTYCANLSQFAPTGYFDITIGETFDTSNNFYNQNNLKYVYMTNFNISRSNGLVFYCKTSAYNGDLANLNGLTFTYSQPIKISFYQNQIYDLGVLDINYTINFNRDTYELLVYQNTFEFNKFSDVLVPLTINNVESTVIRCSIQSIPYSIIFGNFYNVTYLSQVHFYQGFSIAWDYEYNNQYFYNNYFGINFEHRLPLFTKQFSSMASPSREITLIDNNGYGFIKSFNDSNDFYKPNILFYNNFNFNDSYITRVVVEDKYVNAVFGTVSNEYFDSFYFSDVYTFSSSIYQAGVTSNTLYSSNTILDDVNGSTLIPIGSNNYYKNGEWWDIPTHLYNFFIYLVFDAPIISNFTKLVIIIVNFVVEVFEFLISLFAGVENLIFSSIFIGVIVLIFLLKIIFKG